MDGHDAFGREKGEDPLEEMGWSGSPAPSQADEAEAAAPAAEAPAEPRPEARPEPPPQPRPQEPPVMRVPVLVTSTSGPRIGRWILLAVVLAVVGGAAALVGAIGDSVSDLKVPTFVRDGGDLSPEEAPAGLQPRSMVLRGNLAPALRELQREVGGGRLRFLRVDPQSVQVQVERGGQLVLASKRWDGAAEVISSTPTATGPATYAWARVNASAPRRIAEEIGRRTGGNGLNFGYAVLLDAAGLRWSAFTRGGRGYLARPDGRITRSL